MYSNNIKKYRKEKDLRLKDLASLTGISLGYLSHLENGSRSNLSYIIMKKISLALNQEINHIFP